MNVTSFARAIFLLDGESRDARDHPVDKPAMWTTAGDGHDRASSVAENSVAANR
jgi:hypothetical protein